MPAETEVEAAMEMVKGVTNLMFKPQRTQFSSILSLTNPRSLRIFLMSNKN